MHYLVFDDLSVFEKSTAVLEVSVIMLVGASSLGYESSEAFSMVCLM